MLFLRLQLTVTATDIKQEKQAISYSKASGYLQLSKFRLSFLVVLSAVISYFTVADVVSYKTLLSIICGGFLVTAGANGFNQIIEKDLDKLMDRTRNRPLPLGILSVTEALAFCSICAISGSFILGYGANILCGLLGILSVILYAAVYTPLKRKTPFSVFVGAFPGAIPTLIGAVAATVGFGEITFYAWILFAVQFMWQFPHFWAIAWVLDDDYKKAGFRMLPSAGGRDKQSAYQVLIYTLFLYPISLMPVMFHISGFISSLVISFCSIYFLFQAYTLYKECTVEAARKLMFGSFFYLPAIQLAVMIGK